MAFDPNDLAAAVASPRKKATRKGTKASSIVLGLILIAAGLKALYQDRTAGKDEMPLAGVVAEMAKKLPRSPSEGVVIERVALEGRKIVSTIRLTNVTLASVGDADALERARLSQLIGLKEACKDEDARALLGDGAGVARRFIDADGKPLFDVSITSKDCTR